MIDLYKKLIVEQYTAALRMLSDGVDRCRDGLWREPVAALTFNQAVFHALFFTDLYLEWRFETLPALPFHRDHADVFGDYEEVKNRPRQAVYEKPFLRAYTRHCLEKVNRVVSGETESSLSKSPGFEWKEFPRAELHVHNIRHLHHHASQLSLHLRLKTGDGLPWRSSGWGP